MSKSKLKAMLIVFLDVEDEDQTVSQKHYREILIKLKERVMNKGPDIWNNESMVFQHARSQCQVSEAIFSEQVHYYAQKSFVFARFSSMRFLSIPRMMTSLKRTHFQSVGDMKVKNEKI